MRTQPLKAAMLVFSTVMLSFAAPAAAADKFADVSDAMKRAISHFCLPAALSRESVLEYAADAHLEPVEKELLNIPEDGGGRYAWILQYEGGQLILSEDDASLPDCQVFMRRGNARRAQRAIEEILVCEDCFFSWNDQKSQLNKTHRIDNYTWDVENRLISITVQQLLKRSSRSEPVMRVTVKALNSGL